MQYMTAASSSVPKLTVTQLYTLTIYKRITLKANADSEKVSHRNGYIRSHIPVQVPRAV